FIANRDNSRKRMQKYNFLKHNPNNSKRKFKKNALFYSANRKINQKNNFTYLYYIGKNGNKRSKLPKLIIL
ncbi:hypothetical protein, partial [Hoylesella nanceiensis]|uniref:hypothetical protein n=1 Tax=Hoylesella nanceiensis TaxID=425941 RepID=UPI00242CC362